MTAEDKLRGRVIEMLMCDFAIDFDELSRGDWDLSVLAPGLEALRAECRGLITESGTRLTLSEEARPLVRRLAHFFDAFTLADAGYSRVS